MLVPVDINKTKFVLISAIGAGGTGMRWSGDTANVFMIWRCTIALRGIGNGWARAKDRRLRLLSRDATGSFINANEQRIRKTIGAKALYRKLNAGASSTFANTDI